MHEALSLDHHASPKARTRERHCFRHCSQGPEEDHPKWAHETSGRACDCFARPLHHPSPGRAPAAAVGQRRRHPQQQPCHLPRAPSHTDPNPRRSHLSRRGGGGGKSECTCDCCSNRRRVVWIRPWGKFSRRLAVAGAECSCSQASLGSEPGPASKLQPRLHAKHTRSGGQRCGETRGRKRRYTRMCEGRADACRQAGHLPRMAVVVAMAGRSWWRRRWR